MRDSGDEVKLLVMGSVSGLDYGMQTWGIGFHANSCIFELLMQSHYSLPPRPLGSGHETTSYRLKWLVQNLLPHCCFVHHGNLKQNNSHLIDFSSPLVTTFSQQHRVYMKAVRLKDSECWLTTNPIPSMHA